jgi:uncharacterized membrane protein YphA (DoxX/SURF4 family)
MRESFITDAPAATVLVRLMTGSVFLSEGIQKFLAPSYGFWIDPRADKTHHSQKE